MDTAFSQRFISRWEKYFGGADLPICYFYADQVQEEDLEETVNLDRCLIANLKRVQDGYPFVYHYHTPGCSGGKRYTGFTKKLRPKFEYFLSCGIPGELEGERYKKSPQLVEEYLKSHPPFEAPGNTWFSNAWTNSLKGKSHSHSFSLLPRMCFQVSSPWRITIEPIPTG